MKTHFYADTHCHISMFPMNKWEGNMNKRVDFSEKESGLLGPFFTQSDIKSLDEGNIILVFATLYPVEQSFMTLSPHISNISIGNILKKIKNPIINGLLEMLGSKISNFSEKRVKEILGKTHSYFDDLEEEYNILKKGEKNGNYFIANSYNDLQKELQLQQDNRLSVKPSKVAVILNIEGGHVFGFAQNSQKINDEQIHYDFDYTLEMSSSSAWSKKLDILWENNRVSARIQQVKSWNVFSINLAHHFWNQLCGHAMSLYSYKGMALDQRQHLGEGITQLGWKVITELLAADNGRRIYIDMKHMSAASRTQYYDYLKKRKENIPIIFTHAAVNGFSDNLAASSNMNLGITEGKTNIENGNKVYKNSLLYNPWDINMSDEEIRIISDSGGLIGISLDERILMGNKMNRLLKECAENTPNTRTESDYYYINIWVEALVINIMHIVEVVVKRTDIVVINPQNQWETIMQRISLSSDFDGFINPIDDYPTALFYNKNELGKSLVNRLNELKNSNNGVFFNYLVDNGKAKDMQKMLAKKYHNYADLLTNFNVNIPAFVEGITYRNTLRFLQTYFVDAQEKQA